MKEPIAVIGSACRLPGQSNTPAKLWELLLHPRDVLKDFDHRLNLQRFFHENGDTHGSTDVINKSYLLDEDISLFDASFFGISPVEAASMDPQQRLLLETAYEAFEAAGLTLHQIKGSQTGVYVGCMTDDWSAIQRRDMETVTTYAATGTASSIISNRISYAFDLHGPSETIDTACSSSLVALHHAANALHIGDCETALVAGVNLILDPSRYILESKLHMLSPDARCRMWDAAADGYVRGEGAAVLLLKPLSRALEDGDHIDALIRGTGVNSDGQTAGLTVPSAVAQRDLIRQTYRRAGLDPVRDAPQFVECHGTGTTVGDPVEARAISEAFIDASVSNRSNVIHVGSIKTVIGHLEGCAGLAGVLKAILAIKHNTIPPNLLFDELNPEIEPYYGPLQITKVPLVWPEQPTLRASVNSFGFGGTNAHAIIESYESINNEHNLELLGPIFLFFSARSGPSLLRTIKAYIQHLRHNPDINLRDLSWILYSRRSTHRIRASFSGISRDSILNKMEHYVSRDRYEPQLINQSPNILGIFTGQGAQWPAMGRELFLHCPLFRQGIKACEAVLQALPTSIPSCSLATELGSSTNIDSAAISQTLCTAVQISLVNLLTAAGIKFDHVVGHSSGEIAAAYASGIITLEGAMQIAYYRGFHARHAQGPNGEKGGMIAAGMSNDDALEFCTRPEFGGRIQVAAVNAPQSVTISGDLEVILQAKECLETNGIFVRQLKVDTAYHSQHMLPCAQAYLDSLLACKIHVQQPGTPVWHSSVHRNKLLEQDLSALRGPYWVDNMVQPVLFSRAIALALQHGPFDLAIEVGPHPALKGPTGQIFKETGAAPYYTGTLKRGENDIEALSDTVAGVWVQCPSSIDLHGFYQAFSDRTLQNTRTKTPVLIKDLPTYSWDHDRVFWRESRISRRFRTDRDKPHELLGRRTSDDNSRELRWRNVLRRNELPWLSGHEVLGDILLPGAAYVSIALEAGRYLAAMQKRQLELSEVEKVNILRPVVVPDDKAGVETLFTVMLESSASEGDVQIIKAQFSYYVCPDEVSGTMIHTCTGNLTLHLRRPSKSNRECSILPPKEPHPTDLTPLNTDDIYALFHHIGLTYSGLFRSIDTCQRCLDFSTATGVWPANSFGDDEYLVHPALLDVAFQVLLLARTHPNTGQVSSALLPSYIERVRVDGSRLNPARGGDIRAEFETWIVQQTAAAVTGDISIYNPADGREFLQLEGLEVRIVGELDVSHDRPVFSKTAWGVDIVQGIEAAKLVCDDDIVPEQLLRLSETAERMALFYARRLVEVDIDRENISWYHQRMLEAFDKHLELTRKGQHQIMKQEWLEDTPETMDRLHAESPNEVELEMLKASGQSLARVVRGEMHMLEILKQDDLLSRFYMENGGFIKVNQCLARAMQQISFKFPRCTILEIGAGTGATTWSVLEAIQSAYETYTYTDISTGFFPGARERFAHSLDQMVFKVLDIEKDPLSQGFTPHSYDVIISANVLHATRNLEHTLQNIRSLLRPGGYLLLFEVTNTHSLRILVSFGGLSGLWLGEEENRRLNPTVSCADWDRLLRQTGLSGADTVVHDVADEDKHTLSLIVSQAVDRTFLRLQNPLVEPPLEGPPVLLIGGGKLATSDIVGQIQKFLPEPWHRSLHIIPNLDALDSVESNTEIICLHELD
ncbi:hypothetical protein ASPVEDRAFT_78976 [Aspergillus versicolor CBS 583.65]|uniref:Carrier domain-containing protein n=1 Tax=Aspergillus versicolor CBS 583.65 TaxID=1036611 RepID=A0A1L9P6X0_ASPVE|nr:uncharacterized protein ASPVEDRAFT_78976 [Aspergillus versicolor CBS 583.65]OJI97248.1 hypothetical protein ASPVEDRAFT_78976 [Aspergillus versicolor CBS 583.65]